MRTNGSNYEDSHPTEARLLLAFDDELNRHESAAIASHVERCAVCQAQWQQLRRVSGEIVAYHDHVAETPRVPLQDRSLTVAAQNRDFRAARVSKRHAGRLAYAAAALAAACAAWFFMNTSRPSPPPPRQVAVSPPVETKLAPSANGVAAPRHRQPARRPPDEVDAEVASFIALPFSDDALPLGDATVVRVEVPVEELRLTGLTVDGAHAGALLQADLLMGIDGLPRGIRFVQ
jgi:hypothetical protein